MRWKFVIPALIFTALTVIFTVFFLDAIIKRSVISTGEFIFGARVEIAGLKTRFSGLSVRVTGLRVANRDDVWRNLFETDAIHFSLEPLPLFSKKFVIDDMSADGIRWGTKRAASGALPPRQAKKADAKNASDDRNSLTARLMAELRSKASAELEALPPVKAIRDAQDLYKDFSVDKAVTLADLRSVREMEKIQADVQSRYAYYQDFYKNLDIDARIRKAKEAASDLQAIRIQTVQDIAPARERLMKANQTREELVRALNDIKTAQSKIKTDFGDSRDMLAKIVELTDRDIKNVASKLKLPSFSFSNISRSLFGPLWLGRVETVTRYTHMIRKYMPPKEGKTQKVVRPRLRGYDVSFPKLNNPPDFLIKRVSLSGTTGGPGKEGEPLSFKGAITDITSDPALWGRPVRLDLSGAQGLRKLQVAGLFDHTGSVADDRIGITFAGLTAADLKLPSSDYLPSFAQGNGTLKASFNLKGDSINSSLGLNMQNLSYTVDEAHKDDQVRSVLAALWAGVNNIEVNAGVTGTADGLNMSVSSNLDRLLPERMNAVLGQKLTELNNRVRAEVTKLTEQKRQELMAQFNSRRDELLGLFSGKLKELQDGIDIVQAEAKKKEGEISSPLEGQKQKASEDLQKKAKELFKF